MARPKKVTRSSEQNEGRAARVPFGAHRSRLQLSEEDTKQFKARRMVPRWVNDIDGRIQRALSGGYTFVKPEHALSLGDGALHQGNTDEGSRISKVVSRGEPVIRSFLMEISKKYYDEDQAAKEAGNARVDEALRGGQVENQYGPGVTYSR